MYVHILTHTMAQLRPENTKIDINYYNTPQGRPLIWGDWNYRGQTSSILIITSVYGLHTRSHLTDWEFITPHLKRPSTALSLPQTAAQTDLEFKLISRVPQRLHHFLQSLPLTGSFGYRLETWDSRESRRYAFTEFLVGNSIISINFCLKHFLI